MARAKLFFIDIDGSDETIAAAIEAFGQHAGAAISAPAHLLSGPVSVADDPKLIEMPFSGFARSPGSGGDPSAKEAPVGKEAREAIEVEADGKPRRARPGAARVKHAGVRPKSTAGAKMLKCRERPGEVFTIDQAAKLAGVSPETVRVSLSPSAQSRKRACGGFHFSRVRDAPPSADAAAPIRPGDGENDRLAKMRARAEKGFPLKSVEDEPIRRFTDEEEKAYRNAER